MIAFAEAKLSIFKGVKKAKLPRGKQAKLGGSQRELCVGRVAHVGRRSW